MLKLIEDLQSGDNTRIKQAEEALSSYQLSNVTGFCTQCCAILNNVNASVGSRQFTGTLLRKTILQNINSVIGWDHLPKETKQQIKLALSVLLESKDRPVKRTAADNISAICAIELPKNQWPGILQSLIQNVTHQSTDIQQASLMALGFICALMKQKGSFVNQQSLQGIFGGLVSGMKQSNPSIVYLAVEAFISCLSSSQSLFSNEKVTTIVLEQLTNIVKSPDQKNQLIALQAISQMCSQVYFAMNFCIQPLVTFTVPLIQNVAVPQICRGAMQIWSSLLQKYTELSFENTVENYLKTNNAKILANVFMANMTIVQNENDDDQDVSIRQSAYRALCNLGQSNPNDISQLVMNFTSTTIGNQDWKQRQASLKAFTSLLDGLDHETMITMTSAAVMQFLRLLDDNSIMVQVSASFSLSRISEKVPECFINHTQFASILTLLQACLSKKPEISKYICEILTHLFESDFINTSPAVLSKIDQLMATLFKTGMRIDVTDGSLAGKAFLATMMLINKTKNSQISAKYISIIIENFNKIFEISQTSIQTAIHSGIMATLQSCITVVNPQDINTQIIQSIFTLVINYFTTIKDVDASGIYVLAQLSNILPQTTPYIQNIWKYVEHALTKSNESELFKATMILISDLSRFNPDKFSKYVVIINDLLALFANPAFNNQCKFSILTTVGDIFLACPNEAQKYLSSTLDIIEKALGGCVSLLKSNFDYADKLRQILVQTITSIMHSGSTKERQNPIFLKKIPIIIQFIKINNTPQAKPSVVFVRSSMLLSLDLIHIFGSHAAVHFKDNFLLDTLKILQKHNKNGSQQDVLEFAQLILKK